MKRIPPVLRPRDITHRTIDDMRDASLIYCRDYSYTKAFDELMTDAASAKTLAQLLTGKCSGVAGLQCMRQGLLGKWGSARSLTSANSPAIVKGLQQAAAQLGRIPSRTRIDDLNDDQSEMLVGAFEMLDDCKGIGATIASKMLAILRPASAVMWDTPIAAAYGFAHSPAGYRRFLQLMREVASRLRQINDGSELESYLRPHIRQWRAPLAKVIDEWHWIRITKRRTGGV
jgi:hypothetical protein